MRSPLNVALWMPPLRTSLRNCEYASPSGAEARGPKLEKTASRTTAMTTPGTMFLVRSFMLRLQGARLLSDQRLGPLPWGAGFTVHRARSPRHQVGLGTALPGRFWLAHSDGREPS